MKLLYVSRSNTGAPHQFIKEQADVLTVKFGTEIEHFLIQKGGVRGYYKAIIQLYQIIKDREPDIIHVHYGLWSFVVLANKFFFFKGYKVIITFHGSDINKKTERPISLLGARFASHNILVSRKMVPFFRNNFSVLPCGINTGIQLNHRLCTRSANGWGENDFIVLFCSSFDRPVKDPEFAKKVIELFSGISTMKVELIELKGYTREGVTSLMQAADVLLMCSKTEGSPQVIKEAILNALPIIANDVGDVKNICEGIDNCFIVEKNIDEYIRCLQLVSQNYRRIQNRAPVIEKFDNDVICKKLFEIYTQVLN